MKKVIALLVAAVLSLLWVLPVFAQATQPQPEKIQILSVRGFYDLAQTGDAAIVVHWNIDYGDNYTSENFTDLAPASLAMALQLYDTDGTTLLSTVHPYVYGPFQTNGYQQGVSYFYFPSTSNMTPDEPYVVRIQESAAYFATPTSANYTMIVATDWAKHTQTDMYDHFIQLCDLLLAEYPTIMLSTSTDIGIVFSTYGESYFRAATPGIQTLCPTLFYVQTYLPTPIPTTAYDSTLQNLYSARLQGSEIKRGADRLAAHLGLTGYAVLGFVIVILCIVCGIYTHKKGWGLEPGLIGSSIICLAGSVLIGNGVFTVTMIATLVAVIIIMFTLVGRRA